MQTSFEILFVLSMIVPAVAVVAGMAVLLGVLLTRGRNHAGDAAPAQPGPMALEQVVGR